MVLQPLPQGAGMLLLGQQLATNRGIDRNFLPLTLRLGIAYGVQVGRVAEDIRVTLAKQQATSDDLQKPLGHLFL